MLRIQILMELKCLDHRGGGVLIETAFLVLEVEGNQPLIHQVFLPALASQPCRPVRAGRKTWCIASSRGCRMWLMSGMVRKKYVHRLVRPWVKAAYAAWGCVLAMVERQWTWTHSYTFLVTYSSTNNLFPMAAPKCLFPFMVIPMPVVSKVSIASS